MPRTTAIDLATTDHSGFTTMPQDQGQIVEVSYALVPDGAGSGEILRRTEDRSDRSVSYDIAALDLDAEEGSDEEWTPWNGVLPAHGEFEPVVVIDTSDDTHRPAYRAARKQGFAGGYADWLQLTAAERAEWAETTVGG